jgi:hypothetical protein
MIDATARKEAVGGHVISPGDMASATLTAASGVLFTGADMPAGYAARDLDAIRGIPRGTST